MKELYIVGAGGFGREVAWLVERINKKEKLWNLVGFLDDSKESWGKEINGHQVLGGLDFLQNKQGECWVICAIGASQVRKTVIERLEQYTNVRFATLIDPTVLLSDFVEIGEGSILCAGTILTVNIQIGNHVIVNLDCTVGHDAILEDYVTVYPSVNISGNVLVKQCVELGTGTQIIQGKTIGTSSIVGAGAVVVKDIPEKCTAVGIPAKAISFL